jgi:CheY-like chemotaxis protein
MGGSIGVQSEPGEGSTFSFNVLLEVSDEEVAPKEFEQCALPWSECSPATAGGAAGKAQIPPDFSAYQILVAEDNEVNREILLAMLEPTGISIDCAPDGEEAARMFEQAPSRYALIFMDLQMPRLNGIDATIRIRAGEHPSAKSVPIIAMTANVFQEDIERCLAAGMNDHLGKPFDIAAIINVLRKYLR